MAKHERKKNPQEILILQIWHFHRFNDLLKDNFCLCIKKVLANWSRSSTDVSVHIIEYAKKANNIKQHFNN